MTTAAASGQDPVRPGPLAGLRVVELAGIGPAPLCGMVLADLGADVVVIERPAAGGIRAMLPPRFHLVDRGKRRVVIDLKTVAGRDQAVDLATRTGVLVEGFRPGTMERLGLGPEELLARNPALVYARITGWGQGGPRAATAGHDITYLALTGALHAIGRAGEAPVPPVNFLADYAGGTMFGVTGILAALLEARTSGRGQVVDAAMIDGVAQLLVPTYAMLAAGAWRDARGVNLLDSGAPFYDVYRTRDGKYVAIGALEDEFFEALVAGLGIDRRWLAVRHDPREWPALREAIGAVVASRTRDEWEERFRDTDGCVAPVLSLTEAAGHPHQVSRASFTDVAGIRQPAPAPRFSRTPAGPLQPPAEVATIESVLASWS